MTICVDVNNYLNDKLLKDLSIPSTLFIKPNYYTQQISRINDMNNSLIDDSIYDILLNNISINEKLKQKSKPTKHNKNKKQTKIKTRKK
jgi:hypothetical protein